MWVARSKAAAVDDYLSGTGRRASSAGQPRLTELYDEADAWRPTPGWTSTAACSESIRWTWRDYEETGPIRARFSCSVRW